MDAVRWSLNKKKTAEFRNTNSLVGHGHTFLVSKTGFINASGGCIVLMIDTDIGSRIVVVLGSKNTHTRIPEAEFIATKS
jgi:D-alanyl-D-alanine carboxypeptidase